MFYGGKVCLNFLVALLPPAPLIGYAPANSKVLITETLPRYLSNAHRTGFWAPHSKNEYSKNSEGGNNRNFPQPAVCVHYVREYRVKFNRAKEEVNK